MESKDIIKALEICSKGIMFSKHDCKKCPYYAELNCERKCKKIALDLIKNQQAEIVEMRRDLLNEIYALEHQLEIAKTEAYKEFADRLKERASKGFWDELAYVDTDKINDLLTELTERKED